MRKIITIISLGIILVVGVFASFDLGRMPLTYDGQRAVVSEYELQQDPEAYNDNVADGSAAGIIQQNLSETHSVNDVTSIVFDFRGYDTMGEAFILITAVAGATVILAGSRKEEDDE